MKVFYVCKHCGSVRVEEKPEEGKDILVEKGFCEKCEAGVRKDLKLGYANLKTAIFGLSHYDFLFDESGLMELGRLHDFRFKFEKFPTGVMVRLWDANEAFNINTDDELCAMASMAAREFGWEFKRPESKIDEVQGKLAAAIKKDFKLKEDVVIEWRDGVVMEAWLEGAKA